VRVRHFNQKRKKNPMKRIVLALTFVFVFALPTFATSSSQLEQLSKKQLAALVGTARTPKVLLRIANYYRTEANELLTESNHHLAMAAAFRANPVTSNPKSQFGTVNHCEYFVQSRKIKA
jgi:hypothetical protein